MTTNNLLQKKVAKLKTRKVVYLALGIFFILLNGVRFFLQHMLGYEIQIPDNTAERIGYYIGSNFFFVLGLYFLIKAFLFHKKIKQIENSEIDELIDEIGKNE